MGKPVQQICIPSPLLPYTYTPSNQALPPTSKHAARSLDAFQKHKGYKLTKSIIWKFHFLFQLLCRWQTLTKTKNQSRQCIMQNSWNQISIKEIKLSNDDFCKFMPFVLLKFWKLTTAPIQDTVFPRRLS